MNARFSDYVTSGAFNLTLTRNQICELGLIGGGQVRFSSVSAALERKGLVEPIPASTEDEPLHEPDEQSLDHRLTPAGALTLALLAQAGLTNAGADAMAREIDDLRAKLAAANRRAHEAALCTRAMHARLEESRLTIAQLEARLGGEKIPIRPLPDDPLPGMSTDDLLHHEGAAP